MSATCPWCDAPRDAGPICPRCGANYAKAEAIRTHGRADPAAQTEAEAGPEAQAAAVLAGDVSELTSAGVDDAAFELKLCIGALPVMLVLGVIFHVFQAGHFLQRTFLTMPVHELGHATTAWLCGYSAIPTFWKTVVPEARGFVVPVLLAGAVATGMYRSWQAGKRMLLVIGAAMLLLQVAGTFCISVDRANMLITFGGDGMGMVIAVLLMASFFFGKNTQLYTGGLRWGLLAIGAAAYVDMFGTWLAAHRDYTNIPFGLEEGVGLSDASRLVDWYGWSHDQLVNRYLMTGICCLVALVAVYLWGVRQAWMEADAATPKLPA